MIAFVRGPLAYISETMAVVDVSGLGISVQAHPGTLAQLPPAGQEVLLHTHLHVSDSGPGLFGFAGRDEAKLFALLISVSGIGPKVAMGILGTMSPAQVMLAIVAEDTAALSKAPGVGKKTAQRLMLELRDKIKTADAFSRGGEASGAALMGGLGGASSPKTDALDALLALGYGRAEAMQAVMETTEDGMDAPTIIRLSLKKLAR